MKVLMPRIKEFYSTCCDYVSKYSHSPFKNPSVGIPKIYKKSYDETVTRRKNKKKFKPNKRGFISSVYKYNDLLTPCLESERKELFTVDGKNAFKHSTISDVRISTRRQKFLKPPEIATDFYNEFSELFRDFSDFNLNDHCIVEGCFDTNRHTLQAQMDCTNFDAAAIPNIEHYNLLETAIRDTVRKLKIPEFKGVDITDILDYDFNLDTKPGYRYEHYLLKNKKRECVNEAVYLAEERYSSILQATKEGRHIKREEILPGIYTVGARNKREVAPEVGELLTSRAVHMPEFHVEIHGGLFSDLITTDIVEKQEGPIFIGNSFLKCDRFDKLMKDNYCAIEGDWKKFDSTLCNALIISALCISRCYFPEGLLYDNHFLAILDSLIIKDYHVVGGAVYRILHGLPSGSKWTNLIGSQINLIALNYTFSNVKYHERSFAVGGDDFVVFIKKKLNSIDSLCKSAEYLSDKIGMTFKFLKKRLYKNSRNIDDYPVFYKYTVYDGVPVIPLESVLERTLSPWNKRYSNNKEILSFLDNLLPSLGHPSSGCYIYYYFYQYVYFRLTGKVITLKSLIISHFKVFDKMYRLGATMKEIRNDYNKLLKGSRNMYTVSVNNASYLRKIFS